MADTEPDYAPDPAQPAMVVNCGAAGGTTITTMGELDGVAAQFEAANLCAEQALYQDYITRDNG